MCVCVTTRPHSLHQQLLLEAFFLLFLFQQLSNASADGKAMTRLCSTTLLLLISAVCLKQASDTGDMWFCLGRSEFSRKHPDWLVQACFVRSLTYMLLSAAVWWNHEKTTLTWFDLSPGSCSAGAALQYLPHDLQRVS